jgi:hypothetical protein
MTCKVIKQITIQTLYEENSQASHSFLLQFPLMFFVCVYWLFTHDKYGIWLLPQNWSTFNHVFVNAKCGQDLEKGLAYKRFNLWQIHLNSNLMQFPCPNAHKLQFHANTPYPDHTIHEHMHISPLDDTK